MQLTKTKKDQGFVGASRGLGVIDLGSASTVLETGSRAVVQFLACTHATLGGIQDRRGAQMRKRDVGATGRFLFIHDFYESIERTVVNKAVLV